MGKPAANTSDRSKKPSIPERRRIAQIRKRQHCTLLGFWRQCGRDDCAQHQGCAGNPFACFRRHFAEMPRNHPNWRAARVLSRTTGLATAEEALRAAGVPMPSSTAVAPPPPPPPRVIVWPPLDNSGIARYVDEQPASPQAPEAAAAPVQDAPTPPPDAAPQEDERPLHVRLAELEQQRIREGEELRRQVAARMHRLGIDFSTGVVPRGGTGPRPSRTLPDLAAARAWVDSWSPVRPRSR